MSKVSHARNIWILTYYSQAVLIKYEEIHTLLQNSRGKIGASDHFTNWHISKYILHSILYYLPKRLLYPYITACVNHTITLSTSLSHYSRSVLKTMNKNIIIYFQMHPIVKYISSIVIQYSIWFILAAIHLRKDTKTLLRLFQNRTWPSTTIRGIDLVSNAIYS